MPLFDKPRVFVEEVIQESRKVNWPTRLELREATMVVIVSVFLVSIVVGFIDLIFAKLLQLVIR